MQSDAILMYVSERSDAAQCVFELSGNVGEPSHARERRWPADLQMNLNSRRPVMRVVRHHIYSRSCQ